MARYHKYLRDSDVSVIFAITDYGGDQNIGMSRKLSPPNPYLPSL